MKTLMQHSTWIQEEIDWFTIANENFDATQHLEIQEEIDWFTIANENFDATQHLDTRGD